MQYTAIAANSDLARIRKQNVLSSGTADSNPVFLAHFLKASWTPMASPFLGRLITLPIRQAPKTARWEKTIETAGNGKWKTAQEASTLLI
jgi:hypothetical protein